MIHDPLYTTIVNDHWQAFAHCSCGAVFSCSARTRQVAEDTAKAKRAVHIANCQITEAQPASDAPQ